MDGSEKLVVAALVSPQCQVKQLHQHLQRVFTCRGGVVGWGCIQVHEHRRVSDVHTHRYTCTNTHTSTHVHALSTCPVHSLHNKSHRAGVSIHCCGMFMLWVCLVTLVCYGNSLWQSGRMATMLSRAVRVTEGLSEARQF